MNIFLVVLLVLAGVALLLMEMFLLPGFGIAGVSGFLALIGFVRSKALDKMALDAKIDSHVELANNKLKVESEKLKEEDKK